MNDREARIRHGGENQVHRVLCHAAGVSDPSDLLQWKRRTMREERDHDVGDRIDAAVGGDEIDRLL